MNLQCLNFSLVLLAEYGHQLPGHEIRPLLGTIVALRILNCEKRCPIKMKLLPRDTKMKLTEAEEKSVDSDSVDVEENGGNAVGADSDHEHRHHVVVERWHVLV